MCFSTPLIVFGPLSNLDAGKAAKFRGDEDSRVIGFKSNSASSTWFSMSRASSASIWSGAGSSASSGEIVKLAALGRTLGLVAQKIAGNSGQVAFGRDRQNIALGACDRKADESLLHKIVGILRAGATDG